jgi:hypothetical protein
MIYRHSCAVWLSTVWLTSVIKGVREMWCCGWQCAAVLWAACCISSSWWAQQTLRYSSAATLHWTERWRFIDMLVGWEMLIL